MEWRRGWLVSVLSGLAMAACVGEVFETGRSTAATTGAGVAGGDAAGNGGASTSNSGGNGGAATGGEGGNPPVCAPDELAAPPVPASWQGPFVVAAYDAEPPACDGAKLLHDVITAEPTSCNCDCMPDPTWCQAGYGLYHDDSCGNYVTGGTLEHKACKPVSMPPQGNYANLTEGGGPWLCSVLQTAEYPPPHWLHNAQLCPAEPVDGCVTIPSSYEQTLCISAPGQVGCPEGYDHGCRLYGDYADLRGCNGDCDCDDSGITCDGMVVGSNNPDCSGATPINIAPNISCFDPALLPNYLQYNASPSGSCVPLGNWGPVGDLKGAEESEETVCCISPSDICATPEP